jgi:electron transport complex protein RnfG
MSTEVQPQSPPVVSSVAMIRALGLIAMIAGLLVVLVFQYTAPIIKEKERRALEKAVLRVIPGLNQEQATRIGFVLNTQGLVRSDETTTGEANIFAVYDGAGKLAGIALQGAAQGYQDVVRTLYGYNPDCECIVGLTIMKSTDTPGMGDKKTVEGDVKFMANFKALFAKLTADKRHVAHPIETVKHGTKTDPWQVDAMSGATITSKAIGNGLRKSTGELLPLVAQHLPEMEVNK